MPFTRFVDLSEIRSTRYVCGLMLGGLQACLLRKRAPCAALASFFHLMQLFQIFTPHAQCPPGSTLQQLGEGDGRK